MKNTSQIRYLKRAYSFIETNFPGGSDLGKILNAIKEAIRRASK